MALPALVLDNVRFDELVVALRRRIPALSNGRWTLHEAVDPGITLLELFSWQLEQRSYWLDRMPDAMLRAIIELFGEGIEPARCASTILAFPPQPWLALPASSVTRLDVRGVGPKFTIEQPVMLAPIERVGLIAFGRDRSDDLEAGGELRVFAADGAPGEAKVILWLASSIQIAPEPLSLLVELSSPPDLVPGWSPRLARQVAPPATLEFVYKDLSNRFVPLSVDDGTGGLRRSGALRFVAPIDWQPEGPPQFGLTPYALVIRTAHATFTYPPRVSRIVANAVPAVHRRHTDFATDVTWLPLPGTTLALPPAESLVIGQSVQLTLQEASGAQTWTSTESLAFHGPGDRVFEVDREAGRLRFGDGLTGRVPRPDLTVSPNVTAAYDVGAGPSGNLGAGLGWIEEATGLGGHNVVEAADGSEPETVHAARQRMSSALRRVTRAVTAEDYEELALTTPGIAVRRAHAAIGYSSLTPCIPVPGMVTVFVVPYAPREDYSELVEPAFVAAPQPDPGALLEMRARLDDARLVTHEVCVRGPLYRCATVRVEVQADSGEPAELRRMVAARVARFLDPLIGGAGDGWPFGEPLRPSAILRAAQEAIGREGFMTRVAIGLDGCAATEDCHEVPIGDHALVGEVTVEVQVRPQPAAKGALR
jgi:hypothetical protein